MSERLRRAGEILERELRSLENRANTPSPQPRADAEWYASGLLARLLGEAGRLDTPFTAQRARQILEAAGPDMADFDELRRRNLVRVVLGVVELPEEVYWACYRPADPGISPGPDATAPEADVRTRSDADTDTGDGRATRSRLRVTITTQRVLPDPASQPQSDPSIMPALRLLYRVSEEDAHCWWLDAEAVTKWRDLHAAAHPRTPTVETLVAQGFLRAHEHQGQAGYVIGGNGRLQSSCPGIAARVAALAWHGILERWEFESDEERVRAWLERTGNLDTSHAAAHMLEPERERFLDGALALLLNEPDLLGWEHEFPRLEWEIRPLETGWPIGEPPIPLPRPDESAAARWQWWQEIAYSHLQRLLRNDCRRLLRHLILAIITHDPLDGLVEKRGARIVKLLHAGIERPYLAHLVPQLVAHTRPGIIAWLLLRRETASLAIDLLREIRIDFSDPYVEYSLAEIKRRADLYARAMPIFLHHIVQDQGRGPDSHGPAAQRIHDILGPLAHASARAATHDQSANRYLNLLFEMTERALFGQGDVLLPRTPRHVERAERVRGPVLHALHALVHRALSAEGESWSNSFPVASMRIGFWLLGMSVRHERTGSASGDDATLARRIADGLVQVLRRVLDRGVTTDDDGKQKIVHWPSRQGTVARLPWYLVAIALHRDGDCSHHALLQPVDFKQRIQAITNVAEQIGGDIALDKRRLQEFWLQKARFHLQLLLELHEALGREPEALWRNKAHRQALLRAVEEAILELLISHGYQDTPEGRPNLLEPQWLISHDDDRQPSIAQVIRRIEHFTPAMRRRALDVWLDRTPHLGVLLGTLANTMWQAARQRIERRLAGISWDDELEVRWFPRLVDLAEYALDGGDAKLTRTLIDLGDRLTKNQLYEPTRRAQAAELRLYLAWLEKDRAFLEQPIADTNKAQDQKLEKLRLSLVPLLSIETDPDAASSSLQRLAKARPDDRILAINLFAARLQAAERRVTPDEREHAYRQALADWDAWKDDNRVDERFSSWTDDRTMATAVVNELLALHQLDYRARFDELWLGLPDRILFRRSILEQVVSFLLERECDERATEVLTRGREFHQDATGEGPDWLDALSGKLGKRALPPAHPGWHHMVVLPRSVHIDRQLWNELRQRSASELPGVLGASVSTPLRDFLLHAHIAVARELLDRVETLRTLADENKYNDLFVSLLRMRISLIGWDVRDQSRGGQSATKRGSMASSAGPGERDWVITDRNGSTIAISEALRSRYGWEYVREHIRKVERYDPSATEQAYVVVFVDAQKDFASYCGSYLDHVRGVSLDSWRVDGVSLHPEPRGIHNIRVYRGWYERSDTRERLSIDHLLLHIPGSGIRQGGIE